MVAPYRDKGLDVLYDQLHEQHPGLVIGWIGNKKHQGEVSDHNPSTAAHDKGAVDAIDPMLGPHYSARQADANVNALVASRDPRIAYIIWQRRIISSIVHPWVWREYKGSGDPHTGHWHISVNDLHESDTHKWTISTPTPTPVKDDDMDMADLKAGIVQILDEIADAAIAETDPKQTTTQNGRNGLVYLRRILTHIDNTPDA
jgi:hypothetical protein